MADKYCEPQVLTSKTATQISKKGVESSSYAAPIKHFASIPASIDRSDSRLPSFGQQTEFALQRSEPRFRRIFDHLSALTYLRREEYTNLVFLLPGFQKLVCSGLSVCLKFKVCFWFCLVPCWH